MTAMSRRSSRHCCNEFLLSNPSCSPFSKTYYAHCRSHGQDPHPVIMTKALKQHAELSINGDALLLDSDWDPILCALSATGGLVSLSLWSNSGPYSLSSRGPSTAELRDKRRIPPPIIRIPRLMRGFLSALYEALLAGERLTRIEISGIPLSPGMLGILCQGLREATWVKHLLLPRCAFGDQGLAALIPALKIMRNLCTLDFAACGISPQGAKRLSEALKARIIRRATEKWERSLRGEVPGSPSLSGIYRVNLCENTIKDEGASYLADVISENEYMKALDLQRNGITTEGAKMFVFVVREHPRIVILDLRNNSAIDGHTLQILQQSLNANAIMTAASLANLEQQEGAVLLPLDGDDPLADSYHRTSLHSDQTQKKKKKVKRDFGAPKSRGAKPGWNAGTIGKIGTAVKAKKQPLAERLLGFAVKKPPIKTQMAVMQHVQKKQKALNDVSPKRLIATNRPPSRKLSIPTQPLVDDRAHRDAATIQTSAASSRRKGKKTKKVRKATTKEVEVKNTAADNMTLPETVKSLEVAKEYWMNEYKERRERREQSGPCGLASDMEPSSPFSTSVQCTADSSPKRCSNSSESMPCEEDEVTLLLRKYDAIMRKRRTEASQTTPVRRNQDSFSTTNERTFAEAPRFAGTRTIESMPTARRHFATESTRCASLGLKVTTPTIPTSQSHAYTSTTRSSAAETAGGALHSSARPNNVDGQAPQIEVPLDFGLAEMARPEVQRFQRSQESGLAHVSEPHRTAFYRSAQFAGDLGEKQSYDWTPVELTARSGSLDVEKNQLKVSPGEVTSASVVSSSRDDPPIGEFIETYVANRTPAKYDAPHVGAEDFVGEQNIASLLSNWDTSPAAPGSMETSPIGRSLYEAAYDEQFYRHFNDVRGPGPANTTARNHAHIPMPSDFGTWPNARQTEATAGQLILQKLGYALSTTPVQAQRFSDVSRRTEAETLSDLVDKLEVETRKEDSIEASPGTPRQGALFMEGGAQSLAEKRIDPSISIYSNNTGQKCPSENREEAIIADRSSRVVCTRQWINSDAEKSVIQCGFNPRAFEEGKD